MNLGPVLSTWKPDKVTKELQSLLLCLRLSQLMRLPPVHQFTYPHPCQLKKLFKRGIKRDQTLFPTLKDEKFHDS